jgi:hypothetical protein
MNGIVERLAELKALRLMSDYRAEVALLFPDCTKAIVNHRIDVIVYNRKKYWWMRRLEFRV